MGYPIIERFIQRNRSYKVFSPIGMVCHETATPNATAEAEQRYFSNNVINASVHGFVDHNNIIQTLPWNERCWGAGPSANDRFVQVELCHFDGDKFQEVWNKGIWLFAWVFINILDITTVTPDNLMSHKEVSEKWHETNHTDPYGFFADNGKTFDDFRADVQAEIDNQLEEASKVEEWKQKIIDEAKAEGLITSDHNPDDTATKWFVLKIALRILARIGGK